jgi:uncharacterized membrane protein
MGWWIGHNSRAGKRYRRRVLVAMGVYIAVLFSSLKFVEAVSMSRRALYATAILPAIPVIAVLVSLGLYLQEESDEFLRMITVRSLLFASGALVAITVVSDFLRVIAHGAPLRPFACFVVFFVSFGIANILESIVSRRKDDE